MCFPLHLECSQQTSVSHAHCECIFAGAVLHEPYALPMQDPHDADLGRADVKNGWSSAPHTGAAAV